MARVKENDMKPIAIDAMLTEARGAMGFSCGFDECVDPGMEGKAVGK